jgi:hypothetical protein
MRRWLCVAIGGSALLVSLLMRLASLSIDPVAPATFAFVLGFICVGATYLGCRNATSPRLRALGDGAEYVGMFTVISLIGVLASYPIAAFSQGFADAGLQRADVAMGFDWLDWYRMTAAHPWLQLASRAAYAMIYALPAILLTYYAVSGLRREAYAFLTAVWLAALMTLIGFYFMPAVGPFGYLWHAPIPYLPVSDLWQPQLIPQLRQHAMPLVDLSHLVGLVSAPSFHAAAAGLIALFGWRQPPLRALVITLDMAMVLATPVEGTHYLMMVLARKSVNAHN